MKYRHEEQQYLTVADLIAENTITNTSNDVVYCQDVNRVYRWLEGSNAAHDGVYVINQIAESANGRWIATSIAKIFTATTMTSNMENGQSESIDISLPGVMLNKFNLITITNGDEIPDNVFVVSKEVIANDTIRILMQNESGGYVASFSLKITVLEI